MPNAKTSKTTEKVTKIFEMFSINKPEWGVTELSSELDWSKSVTHRILSTLESSGFLQQNKDTSKYQLGYRLIELGSIARQNIELIDLAREEMKDLSKKTGETVLLDIPDGIKTICIDKVESNANIKFTCGIGKPVPIYAGALGKAILAYYPEEKIDNVIKAGLIKHTDNTTDNAEELKKELHVIKQRGYSLTKGEWNPGALGVASPIFDHQENIIASIGVLGPEYRMEKNIDTITVLCLLAANNLSGKI